jgi:hypothetical protein
VLAAKFFGDWSAVSSAVKHRRWKNNKGATLAHRWSLFLLTSCLSTTSNQAHAVSGAPSPSPADKSHDPAKIPDQQYDLLTLSIDQIVDEFFSSKHDVSSKTYAQLPSGPSPAPAPAPLPTPLNNTADIEKIEPFFAEKNYDKSLLRFSIGKIGEGLEAIKDAVIPDAMAQASPAPQPGPQPDTCQWTMPTAGTANVTIGGVPVTNVDGEFFVQGTFVANSNFQQGCSQIDSSIFPYTGTPPQNIPYIAGTCSNLAQSGNVPNQAYYVAVQLCQYINEHTPTTPPTSSITVRYFQDPQWYKVVNGQTQPTGLDCSTDPSGHALILTGVLPCLIVYPQSYPETYYSDYAPPGEGPPPQMRYADGYGDSYPGYGGYADAYGLAEGPPGYCEYGTNCLYGESLPGYSFYECLPDTYYGPGVVADSPGSPGGGSSDCAVGSGGIDVAADSACGGLMATDGCMAFEDPVGGGGSGGNGCGGDDGGAGNAEGPPAGPSYDAYYEGYIDYYYDSSYADSGYCYGDYCNPPPPPYDTPPPAYDAYADAFYDSYAGYECKEYADSPGYEYGRTGDSYAIPAMAKDSRFRDLCITGGTLPQSDFDTQTGLVDYFTDPVTGYTVNPIDLNLFGGDPYANPDLIPLDYITDAVTVFDEKIAGTVSGVKPTQVPQTFSATPTQVNNTSFIDTCMPAKDTPALPLSSLSKLSKPNVQDPITGAITALQTYTPNQAANLAFNFFVNINDTSTYDALSMDQIYASSFPYLNSTFFIMGPADVVSVDGCFEFLLPPNIGALTGSDLILATSQYRQAEAENCYNYYILNHSITPWFTLERPSGGTGEGLSTLKPDRSISNNCQPLMNGNIANALQQSLWEQKTTPAIAQFKGYQNPDDMERGAGFSPVLQAKGRPDVDEAEYLISTYLQKSWDSNFNPGTTPPATNPAADRSLPNYQMAEVVAPPYVPQAFTYPAIALPCVADPFGNPVGVDNPEPIAPSCAPPPSDSPAACPPHRTPPASYAYKTAPTARYYCPNVEKIVEPSHPYSPRNDIATKSPDGSVTPHTQIYTPDPTTPGALKWAFTSKTLTDRDYSYLTSTPVNWYKGQCGNFVLGWSNFSAQGPGNDSSGSENFLPYADDGSRIDKKQMADPTDDPIKDPSWQTPHPVVQCGIVPVDILSFRSAAFDNCIMQRIDINYNAFVQQSMDQYNNHGVVLHPFDPSDLDRTNPKQAGNFVPPCATRFWETDDMSTCPVKMSIQQCCHIIVKDLVPANFLKLRTCEGLLDNRRTDNAANADNSPDDIQEYFYSLEKNSIPPAAVGADPTDHVIDPGNSHWGDATTGWLQYAADVTTLNDNSAKVHQDLNDPTSPMINLETIGITYGTNTGVYNFVHDTPANYNKILLSAVILNHSNDQPTFPVTCNGTEPKEYTFAHWFQPYYLPEDPAITTVGTDFTDITSHYGELVGYHMPYMRWWDTGASAGQDVHGGSFINTLGGFDTLIGAGREERDAYDAVETPYLVINATTKVVGLGPDLSTLDIFDYLRLGQTQASQMGRIGGWAELKAHEMETMRRFNLFCIGRYEKLFKQDSAEEFVLGKAGSGFDSFTQQHTAWPLGWRGYVTDTYLDPKYPDGNGKPYIPTHQFPYVGSPTAFGTPGMALDPTDFPPIPQPTLAKPPALPATAWGNTLTGLDNALPHDIVVYKINGIQQVAYVSDVHVTNTQYPYVTLLTWDQGKFPTSTGSSISAGFGRPRNIFKTATPPDQLTKMTAGVSMYAENSNTDLSCADPFVNSCVLPVAADADPTMSTWNNVKIYRPYQDLRPCLGSNTPKTYNNIGNYILGATYAYQPWVSNAASRTGVILQQFSEKITTDLWGYCLNAGYDPPPSWGGNYSGPGTGATSKTAICGPEWGDCSTASQARQYFPKTTR